jgi:hypothetical protein
MRDWLLALAPLALVIYFVMYPAKFYGLIQWMVGLMR